MNTRIAALLALALTASAPAAAPAAAPAGAAAAAAPVALVVGLDGSATALEGAPKAPQERPLRLFDKLPAGATLRTGAGSTVRLLFTGGARYALPERSTARLDRAELRSLSGSLVKLPPLPAVLVLAPISPEDNPGDRFPTLVLRTQEMTGVYPRGAVTLDPAQAVLHFDPVSATPSYHVQVSEKQSGDPVYTLETAASEVTIPADRLKPGRCYQWSVQTVNRIGPKAEGRGAFRTATPETDAAQARFDAMLAAEPALDVLLLKIAVDLNLGRYREVYQGLREASRRLPQDSGLAAAARDWGKRLDQREPAPATPPPPLPAPTPQAPSSSGGRSSW